MYLVNGIKRTELSIADRGFQYGDGCFTTMLVKGGNIQLWLYHKERLQLALSRLSIKEPDWEAIQEWLVSVQSPKTLYGIKILISRGQGGRGYGSDGCNATQVVISSFDFPKHYLEWADKGIDLAICKTQLGHNPLLAGIKHNNRLEQVLIKQELSRLNAIDGVVCGLDGNVVETSVANLFWVRDKVLYTPATTLAGVDGVMRRHVLSLTKSIGLCYKVVTWPLEQLLGADEVFITNSLMQIVPVNRIGSQEFTSHTVTRQIQETLNLC
ncbi:aminodeoxychorismate lyase [Vibrio sp. Of7-15]|uniref:aminodeoxychorismate lyase n=1 Tax=Vibrio sp. Of7-15 TaxID=2724879 RepID=UPI001EF28518|nr:aminodeoxychorismate lyase [Vibrio sp. Of7-15]MCG7496997.1 aminodeoxychorismate lyase [Vibrio sp. Of7-15]